MIDGVTEVPSALKKVESPLSFLSMSGTSVSA
jgi:hypothetical protein